VSDEALVLELAGALVLELAGALVLELAGALVVILVLSWMGHNNSSPRMHQFQHNQGRLRWPVVYDI